MAVRPGRDIRTLGAEFSKIVAPYADAQRKVVSRTVLNPPVSPEPGDRFIVPPGATGAWTARTNQIAAWAETAATGWTFYPVEEGMSAWVSDERIEAFFNGTRWGTGTGETVIRGITTPANRRMPTRATSFDGDRACDIAMAFTPAPGSAVIVAVNGVLVSDIGDGSKLNCAGYFSPDGGFTARRIVTIHAGDCFYWCGTYARYQLRLGFKIDFIYEVA